MTTPRICVVQSEDANGDPLPLDTEGNLIGATQAIAVDLGRLKVGRSTTGKSPISPSTAFEKS